VDQTPIGTSGAEKHYLERELDELLARDRAMWRFLRAGSLDGVWYWDLERRDQEWLSPELWELFGIDPATMPHDPASWQDIIHPDDLRTTIENFEAHCADPSHPYDQVVRYRHADGSTIWVRCRGIAIRDDAGRPIRLLGAHTDITAAKRAEERAQAERRKLEVVNEDLRAFAYGVSHDLKAPANTLSMLLGALAETQPETLSRDQRELVDMAQTTVGRMQSLIEELLRYSRLFGDPPASALVDLAHIVDEVLEDLGSDIANAKASISIGVLPSVPGHATQLRALFQNLIANALKYRDPARDLAISIQTGGGSGDMIDIRVSDSGIGIDPDDFERIFRLFQRLHLDDDIPGTGLGLTLCRKIALNHHGQLRVESMLGQGSMFILTLPRGPR